MSPTLDLSAQLRVSSKHTLDKTVIPAPIVYINVVAVKKLVVEIRRVCVCPYGLPILNRFCLLSGPLL